MSQAPVSKFAFLCAHKRPDHIPIASRDCPWIAVKAIENPRLDIVIQVMSGNYCTRQGMEEGIALISPEFFWGFTSFLSASKMTYRKIKVVLGAILGNESVGLLAVLRTVVHVSNFWFCFSLRKEVEHSHAVYSTAASYCDVDGDLEFDFDHSKKLSPIISRRERNGSPCRTRTYISSHYE